MRREELARDHNANWMTAIEMFDDDTFIGAEHTNNLFTVRKNADAVNDEERARLETQGVGMATVTAAMLGGAASASGTLLVFDEVLAFSSGLTWTIALQAEETLVEEAGGTRATQAALAFDNGVVFPDVAGGGAATAMSGALRDTAAK